MATVSKMTSNKWAGIPLPDLNRPAFFISTLANLASCRRCTTCKKDVEPTDFTSELQKKEYSMSGMCAKCQGRCFATPSPERHYCSAGLCQPAVEVDAVNTACDECLTHLMSELSLEEPKEKGVISAIQGQRYQCYAGYTCSLHGQKAIVCLEDREDKHETWGCRTCGAEADFRVRTYDWRGWEN